MATEIIEVRKKNNHKVIRSIKVSAFNAFKKFGWEIVPNQETVLKTVKKKEAVAPVAELESDFASPSETVTETSESPITGEQSSIDALRDEYQTITGKPADKRWNVKRISEELNKLK